MNQVQQWLNEAPTPLINLAPLQGNVGIPQHTLRHRRNQALQPFAALNQQQTDELTSRTLVGRITCVTTDLIMVPTIGLGSCIMASSVIGAPVMGANAIPCFLGGTKLFVKGVPVALGNCASATLDDCYRHGDHKHLFEHIAQSAALNLQDPDVMAKINRATCYLCKIPRSAYCTKSLWIAAADTFNRRQPTPMYSKAQRLRLAILTQFMIFVGQQQNLSEENMTQLRLRISDAIGPDTL